QAMLRLWRFTTTKIVRRDSRLRDCATQLIRRQVSGNQQSVDVEPLRGAVRPVIRRKEIAGHRRRWRRHIAFKHRREGSFSAQISTKESRHVREADSPLLG